MVDQKGEGDRAREDFFSEAQELVDGLGRDVLALDELSKGRRSDPELINDVFCAVHTLKGLSGLFGASMMSGLSHELEDVLDDLRLGPHRSYAARPRRGVSAVELYGLLLAAEQGVAPIRRPKSEALLVALGCEVSHRGRAGSARAPSLSTSSTPACSAC